MTVYCFTKDEWVIWLQSVTVILNSQNSKVLLQSINQLLRRNKISLDEWPLSLTKADRHYKGQQLLWSAREPNALMFQIKFTERNRTCCRFLFFCKLTAATVLKLCKEHFLTEKPWGRDRVEKCDVTLPW